MLQECDSRGAAAVGPERAAQLPGPAFRSLRRRLLVTLAPLSVLLIALVAIAVGRVSRHIATGVVRDSTVAFLEVLGPQLVEGGLDRERAASLLRRPVLDPQRAGFVVGEGGEPWLVVGPVSDPAALLADGGRLAHGPRAVATIGGFGPIRLRLVAAVRLDERHVLVLERRIHGLWTPYTLGALLLAIGVVAVGVGSALAVSAGLYGPVVRRLGALESALVRYGEGDTACRLNPSAERQDEIDRVFAAFDAMADRIAALEAERRLQVEAERALLADLAHDVNTPITVLRGYAETLLERGDDLDAATRRSVHTELLGQSLYVQAIVEDLLTLASARVATLAVRPQRVAVDQLFDSVVDAFQPLAGQRGAALLGDAGGVVAWADPVRLRQILTNLVRNAILHATGATVIELGAEAGPDGVLLWVEDDGPGVPPEVVPRLFERRPAGERGAGPGWGLGLAIVRTLAELHGGTARYAPGGRGARFEVRLPDGEGEHAPGAAG